MTIRGIMRYLVIIFVFISLSFVASAQGGPLFYGEVSSATLNPGTPIIYTFSGNEGDLVSVYVITDSNVKATLSVSNSSGIPIGFSADDPLTPMTNDVRVTAQLPATDTYIVTLNNTSDSVGNYTLTLSSEQIPAPTPLFDRTTVIIEPEGSAQAFSIAGTSIPQVISIQSLNPTLGFYAQLLGPDGTVLAVVAGGIDGMTFVAPAADSNYTLIVNASDPTIRAEIEIAILAGGAPPPPAATEEAAAPADPNACVATSAVAGGVNVRSGPGTGYSIIGSLTGTNQLIVTGQNSRWYTGNYAGQSGWVAQSVVTLSGNCGNLAFVDAPPLPATQAPSGNATSTATATTSGDATATMTATTTTNSTATATATATEVAFVVVSMSCRWLQNDGATVDFSVEGAPSATFQIDVRQGATTYSATRTLNDQGFLIGNQRFGQAGNSNYVAYIVYNGVDMASADC